MLDAFGPLGCVSPEFEEGIRVEADRGYFRIIPDQKIQFDLEPDALKTIKHIIVDPYFALIEYSNINSLNEAMCNYPARGIVLVDNDHGLITTIEDIRERIIMEREWIFASN